MSTPLPAATAAKTDPYRDFVATCGGTVTPEQFRGYLKSHGLTLADWARERGYTPRQVSLVLNGQIKARYGKGHAIAVAMGLKPAPGGVPERRAA